MPLIKSRSKKAVSQNIKTEMEADKPQKQAVAIALSEQRRAGYAAGGDASRPGFKVPDPQSMLAQGLHPMSGYHPTSGRPSPSEMLLAGIHPMHQTPLGGQGQGHAAAAPVAGLFESSHPSSAGDGSGGANDSGQSESDGSDGGSASFANGGWPGLAEGGVTNEGSFQEAQAPPFQIRQNGNGTLSVINVRTGQVMSTHQDPGSARNAAASWNASSHGRPYAEGGVPRSPVPEYLLEQQRQERTPGADSTGFTEGLFNTAGNIGQLVAVPVGIAKRGYEAVKEDLANIDERSRAMAEDYKDKSTGDKLWEAAREGAPQAAMAATGPVGAGIKAGFPMIARAAEAYPRVAGALEGAFATGAGNLTSRAFEPSQAHAGEAQAGEPLPEVGDGRDPVKVKRLQEFLINKGALPATKKGGKATADGVYGEDTQRAADQYRANLRGEEDRAIRLRESEAASKATEAKTMEENRKTEEARTKAAADALAQQNLEAGNKKLDELEKNKSIASWLWQKGAPWLGLGLGIAGGVKARSTTTKFADKFTQQRADQGDQIMRGIKGGKAGKDLSEDADLARAATLNDFSRRGHTGFGRTQVPFTEDGDLVPPMFPNPKATPTEQLYTPQRARNALTDTAVIGTGLGDALGIGHSWLIPKYEAERDKALADLKANPNNNAAISAFYNAEDALGFAKMVGNIGYGTALGYGSMMPKWKYQNAIPESMSKYGTQRAQVTKRFNERGYSEANPVGAPRPLPPPVEGGTLRAESTNQLPGPNTGQVPPHKAQEPAGGWPTPEGQAGTGQSTQTSEFPNGPQPKPSQEPPAKTKAEAEAELAANRRQARSQKAAAARKAKNAPPPEEEGFAFGGDVDRHHSFFQPREQGRFSGGPVYPGSGSDAPGVEWPGYEPGGTVGQPGQHYWENYQGPAAGKHESFWSGYMPRTGWGEVLRGIGDALSAAPPARGAPIRYGSAKGLNKNDFMDIAPAKEKAAIDKGWDKFLQSGPEQAGGRKFDPGIFSERPNMPEKYEGEMWDPVQPVPYPSKFANDLSLKERVAGRKSANDLSQAQADYRSGEKVDPLLDYFRNPDKYIDKAATEKLQAEPGYKFTKEQLDQIFGPKGNQIEPPEHVLQRIEAEWEAMAKKSRQPDLSVIQGDKPAPRGPYEPGPESDPNVPEKAGGGGVSDYMRGRSKDYEATGSSKGKVGGALVGAGAGIGAVAPWWAKPLGVPVAGVGFGLLKESDEDKALGRGMEAGAGRFDQLDLPDLPTRAFGGPPEGPPQMPSGHGDGPPIGGPVMGEDPGRADTKPISVTSGSYVIPADVVSALGEGNTTAGMKKLVMTFPHDRHAQMAGQMGQPVPIKISDGEFVVTPDQVARIGGGDLKQGHALLDRIVQKVRAQHISNLKSMPPPAKG